jgi:hypothetical protein
MGKPWALSVFSHTFLAKYIPIRFHMVSRISFSTRRVIRRRKKQVSDTALFWHGLAAHKSHIVVLCLRRRILS